MDLVAAQFPSGVFEAAFTLALLTAGLLLVGTMVSLAVFAYRSVRGEGPRDPEEVVPEKVEDDLEEGGQDDEWDYY